MSEENIGFVRGLYEAFNKGDVEAVLGSFDENIDWYEAEGMPQGGHYQGPQAIADNVFGPVVNDIDGFAVTPDELFAGGDEVVVIVTYSGTARESGKDLRQQAVHTWTVRDGKIARFRQFMDTVKYNEVLGVAATA
jgi:ketosteroid isomerase-like protein